MNKIEIRRKILSRMKNQEEEDRDRKSLAIKDKLFGTKEFNEAKKILLYFGKSYEVNTVAIIKEAKELGKRVFLPVTDVKRKRLIISEISDDLEKQVELGPYGIYQPKKEYIKETKPESIDLAIMPGIAFDRKGNRIGHGGGYYDKFLRDIPHNIPRIGLAFDFQVVSQDIPSLPHDIAVTRVITDC